MNAFSSPASRNGFFVLGLAFLIIGLVVSTALVIIGVVFLAISVVQSAVLRSRPAGRDTSR